MNAPDQTEKTVRLRYFILLHVLVAIAGTVAFWWFVLPDYPAEAAADGISAGAIAGYAEIMVSRFR
jgi:hypothetical protein